MRLSSLLGLMLICTGCAGSVTEQTTPSLTESDQTSDLPASSSEQQQADDKPAKISDAVTQTQIPKPDNESSAHTTDTGLVPDSAQSDDSVHDAAEEIPDVQSETPPDTLSVTDGPADPSTSANLLQPASPDPSKVSALQSDANWFEPASSRKWYKQAQHNANKTYLAEYFKLIGYELPKHTYALIAPIKSTKNKLSMQYYSYHNTAFEYSMTPDGQENYWPASTVKLAACLMALLTLKKYGLTSQAVISYTNIEGKYSDTVEKLCREAIIPSNNASYNRLMEIAGFDEINDQYLPNVFHFPKMVMQRRYVRRHPEDSVRISPEMQYAEGNLTGVIPERRSSGKMRPQCPRESNCTTLAELAEVMFRTVLHDELPDNRKLALSAAEMNRVRDALKKAPSCIGDGVAAIMGKSAIVYNKGGKVTADDRLEIAVVSSADKKERYLIALSTPYYVGVEQETNRLAMYMIEAMRERPSDN